MKKNIYLIGLISLFIVAAVAIGVTSCTKETETPYYNFADSVKKYQGTTETYNLSNEKVVGTWKGQDDMGTDIYVFNKDYTGSFSWTRDSGNGSRAFNYKMITDSFGLCYRREYDASSNVRHAYFAITEDDKMVMEECSLEFIRQ